MRSTPRVAATGSSRSHPRHPREPPGIHTADERVQAFKTGPQATWFNHVNVNAHDHGGHVIPCENPDAWVGDLRRTFHDRRP